MMLLTGEVKVEQIGKYWTPGNVEELQQEDPKLLFLLFPSLIH